MSDKLDLNAPEVQEAIKAAVETALSEQSGRIAELSKENAKWRRLAQGKDGISQEELDKIQSERDDLQAKLTQAHKELKTATTTAEKATKALADEQGFTTRLLADNGLSDALVKAGVSNPVHLKAVKAMLAGQVQIMAEGDTRVAKIGDKALADYVTEWAKSDEGKHFVSAAQNNGGGAHGGAGQGGAQQKTVTRQQFESMSQVDRMAHAKAGGTITET